MKHDIRIEGHAFALRPVALADAPLILELRTDPQRTRYVHAIEPTLEAQEAYLRRYFARPDDYYFAVERRATGRPEGLIGLYDLDPEAGSMQVGRWVLRPGSWAALESLWLVCRVGFERLGLREVRGRVAREYASVLAFHHAFGATPRASVPGDGRDQDEVETAIAAADWPELHARHSQRAARIARRLDREHVTA